MPTVHPLPIFKTGDSLVARGSGKASAFIAGWTWTRTAFSARGLPVPSHTAAILMRDGIPWVYESTSLSTLPDGVDGRKREGVQAHELSTWLHHYPGHVWHVPLSRKLPNPGSYGGYLKSRHSDQRAYDRVGAVRSASWLARLFTRAQRPVTDSETGKPLYCTAFYLYALRHGGMFPPPEIVPSRHYPRSALTLPFSGTPRLIKEP